MPDLLLLGRQKQQTLTVLLTMEAEYVALSMAMQEQLPLVNLLKEIVSHNVNTSLQPMTIHSKLLKTTVGH